MVLFFLIALLVQRVYQEMPLWRVHRIECALEETLHEHGLDVYEVRNSLGFKDSRGW